MRNSNYFPHTLLQNELHRNLYRELPELLLLRLRRIGLRDRRLGLRRLIGDRRLL